MPHDASIFVGSLPSNMDHIELGRLLSDHLSGYPQVQTVKVVRDAKGGVCAFIQCEDAPSAAQLLDAFKKHPPRAFLGRYLRFEPARAFRTLLISYRAPTRFEGSGDPREGQTVELPVHNAMRIHRAQGQRYIGVTYDELATNFVLPVPPETADGVKPKEDVFSGAGILFAPLQYDDETIRRMAEAFGPLEYFGLFTASTDGNGSTQKARIYPHNARRSPCMDESIWEVKWRHRDDCVSALTTLRKIVHITITWAHRMPNASSEAGVFGTPTHSSSPHFTPYSSPQHARTHSHSYSPHLGYQRFAMVPAAIPQIYAGHPVPVPLRMPGGSGSLDGLSPASPEKWTFAHSTPFLQEPTTSLASSGQMTTSDAQAQSPQWSETDFPPLRALAGLMDHGMRWADSTEVQEVDGSDHEPSTSPSPSSSLSVQPATPVPPHEGSNADDEDGGVVTSSPSRLRIEVDDGQELAVPPTPEFSVSSLTPITPRTATSSFPRTPQSAHHTGFDQVHVDDGSYRGPVQEFHTPRKGGRFGVYGTQDDVGFGVVNNHGGRELDPLTIFVGGLEMYGPHAWDEEKLRRIFEQYGEIEDIQLVRPPSKKSAFSFVKFRNAEASSRAVAAEHNRIYDGRQIRVQLRDTNPQRSPWRFTRGRGRMHHFTPPPRLYHGVSSDMYGESTHGSLGLTPTTTSETIVASESSGTYMSSVSPVAESKHRSSGSSESIQGNSQFEVQRTQSANTNPSISTTPSSMAYPTTVGPVAQYPIPPMGYFPQQWMPAYPPSYPYGFPFLAGYMGFPPSTTQQTSGEGPAAGGAQAAWMGANNMYKPMIPYPPNGEQGYHQGPPTQPGTQPPVRATGFIQGEHGTLIPVYQPEALDQYMSGSQPNAQTRQDDSPQPTLPSQVQATAAPTMSHPMPMWQPYPQVPMYPYMYHPPSMAPSPTHPGQANIGTPVAGNGRWVPNPSVLPYPVSTPQAQHLSQSQPHLHSTPPPYAVPTPPAAPLGRAPQHRPPPSPNTGYIPASQHQGRPYQRRQIYGGHGGNGQGRNDNFNRSFNQVNRGAVRHSPNQDHGSQTLVPAWRPVHHS
ncbi:unnamed protein product [Somion occarium]